MGTTTAEDNYCGPDISITILEDVTDIFARSQPKGRGQSQEMQAVWYLLFIFFEAQIRSFEIAQCAL